MKKRIYLVERLDEKNQIKPICYVSSIKQLYNYLEGRFAQARKEMPSGYNAIRQRVRKFPNNLGVWLWEGHNYRVTVIEEYRVNK